MTEEEPFGASDEELVEVVDLQEEEELEACVVGLQRGMAYRMGSDMSEEDKETHRWVVAESVLRRIESHVGLWG